MMNFSFFEKKTAADGKAAETETALESEVSEPIEKFLDRESERVEAALAEKCPQIFGSDDRESSPVDPGRRRFLRILSGLAAGAALGGKFRSAEANPGWHEKGPLAIDFSLCYRDFAADYLKNREKYIAWAEKKGLAETFSSLENLINQHYGRLVETMEKLRKLGARTVLNDLGVVYALMIVESGVNPRAVNADNFGLLQVQLATAEEVAAKHGITFFNLKEPTDNILLGALRLEEMLRLSARLSVDRHRPGSIDSAANIVQKNSTAILLDAIGRYNQGPYYDNLSVLKKANPQMSEDRLREMIRARKALARDYEDKVKMTYFYYLNREQLNQDLGSAPTGN
ncbi:MAG TPA: hypothetical protein ENJ77_01035 [Candidatus Moranbacteria bacterium]|nr:hypothetical protein [Candidatus Moranbacteria bacterium]